MVRRAVILAESTADNGTNANISEMMATAAQTRDIAHEAAEASETAEDGEAHATLNAVAAAATFAVRVAVLEDERVKEVAEVALATAEATAQRVDIHSQIRRDFDHLSRLAEWQEWDDDTPVSPEVFGPLWPEGTPKGWPPITDVPQRDELVIEAFARERATEQVIEDDIVNLFDALNRYHIARSGVRLTLDQFRALLPAFVTAEV